MRILLRIFENIFKFAQLSLQHYGAFTLTYCLTTKNRLCKLQTYYIKYIYIYIPRLAAARKSLAGLQVYRPIGCILPWPFYAIILSTGIEQQHLILKRQYNKMKSYSNIHSRGCYEVRNKAATSYPKGTVKQDESYAIIHSTDCYEVRKRATTYFSKETVQQDILVLLCSSTRWDCCPLSSVL